MTGTCMAEMKNAEDAQNAIQHLRGCTIFDKDLEFTFSRNEVFLYLLFIYQLKFFSRLFEIQLLTYTNYQIKHHHLKIFQIVAICASVTRKQL